MKTLYPLLLLLCFPLVSLAEASPLKIGLIGDSTVCDYSASSSKRGWGQMLAEFFVPGTEVINFAKGGLSSKSFPKESWKALLAKKPDFIFIQFGHNDMKRRDPNRYTRPEIEYRLNLRQFAEEAKATGAVPIFVTPVRRRTFENGKLTEELRPYAEAMKAESAALSVLLIDLYESSGHRFAELGEERSTSYTINFIDQDDRPGQGDRSHFTEFGAREIARMVITEASQKEPRIKAALRPSISVLP